MCRKGNSHTADFRSDLYPTLCLPVVLGNTISKKKVTYMKFFFVTSIPKTIDDAVQSPDGCTIRTNGSDKGYLIAFMSYFPQ